MDMFIDGGWRQAASGTRHNVVNPATGAVVDTVPTGGQRDADIAIVAAERAFKTWRRTPIATRARLQKRAANLMRERAPELGRTLTSELGRPLAAAITEIERSADLMDVYAEEGLRIHAEMPLTGTTGEKVIVTREPVGVVIAITPFNYPVTLLTFKLGAALIAGCTVVAKPAEDTPLSTLMLAGLFHEAGFPPGCFNVVTGKGRDIGMAMIEHPIPREVAFTGGTIAGKTIAAAAAATMKRVTLELGGQCPAIVCEDADLDSAAAAIARHAFANSVQGSSATGSIASMSNGRSMRLFSHCWCSMPGSSMSETGSRRPARSAPSSTKRSIVTANGTSPTRATTEPASLLAANGCAAASTITGSSSHPRS